MTPPRKYLLLGLFGLLGIVTRADAGSSTVGYIVDILTFGSGQVLFNHTGTHTSVPSCAASYATRWALNGGTPGGQTAMATLLTAYSLHKQIVIIGSGDCSVWPDTETATYIQIID